MYFVVKGGGVTISGSRTYPSVDFSLIYFHYFTSHIRNVILTISGKEAVELFASLRMWTEAVAAARQTPGVDLQSLLLKQVC